MSLLDPGCASLHWRHNGRGGFSNHQPHGCLLNRLFRIRSKKHQSFASLAFVQGIHRWPVNSPHKWRVTRKMFPFASDWLAVSGAGEAACTLMTKFKTGVQAANKKNPSKPHIIAPFWGNLPLANGFLSQMDSKEPVMRKIFPCYGVQWMCHSWSPAHSCITIYACRRIVNFYHIWRAWYHVWVHCYSSSCEQSIKYTKIPGIMESCCQKTACS